MQRNLVKNIMFPSSKWLLVCKHHAIFGIYPFWHSPYLSFVLFGIGPFRYWLLSVFSLFITIGIGLFVIHYFFNFEMADVFKLFVNCSFCYRLYCQPVIFVIRPCRYLLFSVLALFLILLFFQSRMTKKWLNKGRVKIKVK